MRTSSKVKIGKKIKCISAEKGILIGGKFLFSKFPIPFPTIIDIFTRLEYYL